MSEKGRNFTPPSRFSAGATSPTPNVMPGMVPGYPYLAIDVASFQGMHAFNSCTQQCSPPPPHTHTRHAISSLLPTSPTASISHYPGGSCNGHSGPHNDRCWYGSFDGSPSELLHLKTVALGRPKKPACTRNGDMSPLQLTPLSTSKHGEWIVHVLAP